MNGGAQVQGQGEQEIEKTSLESGEMSLVHSRVPKDDTVDNKTKYGNAPNPNLYFSSSTVID